MKCHTKFGPDRFRQAKYIYILAEGPGVSREKKFEQKNKKNKNFEKKTNFE